MLPDRPRQAPGLLVEQAGPETLIYHAGGNDPSGGAVHALNPTARVIWDHCDGAHTLADIEAALRAAFDVPPDRDLLADIRQTLLDLQSKHLLAP